MAGSTDAILLRLAERLNHSKFRQKAAVPDFPFTGKSWFSSEHPRLAVIGKANLRWPPPNGDFLGKPTGDGRRPFAWYVDQGHAIPEILAASRAAGAEFRTRRVGGYYSGKLQSHMSKGAGPKGYASPWWQAIVEIAGSMRMSSETLLSWRDSEHLVPQVMDGLYTSNLYPISFVEANPNPEFRRFQRTAGAVELLREELKRLQSRAIWLPVGNGFDQEIRQVLGATSIDPIGPTGMAMARVTVPGFEGSIVRSRHPQGATREGLEAVLSELSPA